MYKYTLWVMTSVIIASSFSFELNAGTRRDEAAAGSQSSKKAQYMVRQLHNEKQELQAKLAELQQKFDALNKEHDKAIANLEKSSQKNEKLVSRVKGDINKYNDLVGKFKEAVTIIKKSNLDNQYMVRAVQEREEWINQCNTRNEDLFSANSDLLLKYGEAAGSSAEPFTGISTVEIENEMQDYQFKLEDLQVTKFKPRVDVASHARKIDEKESVESDEKVEVN